MAAARPEEKNIPFFKKEAFPLLFQKHLTGHHIQDFIAVDDTMGVAPRLPRFKQPAVQIGDADLGIVQELNHIGFSPSIPSFCP